MLKKLLSVSFLFSFVITASTTYAYDYERYSNLTSLGTKADMEVIDSKTTDPFLSFNLYSKTSPVIMVGMFDLNNDYPLGYIVELDDKGLNSMRKIFDEFITLSDLMIKEYRTAKLPIKTVLSVDNWTLLSDEPLEMKTTLKIVPSGKSEHNSKQKKTDTWLIITGNKLHPQDAKKTDRFDIIIPRAKVEEFIKMISDENISKVRQGME